VAGPPLLSPGPAILLVALTIACVFVAYSAWVWRVALAERRAAERGEGDGGAYAASGGPAG
jgi:hypothetical protein